MKRCKCGPTNPCRYTTNGGYCSLPDGEACIAQEGVDYQMPIPYNNEEYCIQPQKINNIKISCDEITLTKDSVGIEVNIQGLIQNIDKFETIEINGRVFKRVRDKEDI